MILSGVGLWQKLINSNIHGKILNFFFSFYDNIKSCVKSRHTFSDFLTNDIGVKQGEMYLPSCLSSILDLEEFLTEHCKTGIDTLNSLSLENLNEYIKLFLLLYADENFPKPQQ